MSPVLDLSSDLDLNLATVLQFEPMPRLQWSADHTRGPQPVAGGWDAVRGLVGALDGRGWPWLVMDDLDNGHSFQVLGTAEEMIIEVAGSGGGFLMAARPGILGSKRLMPPECRCWIEMHYACEGFTAAEAAAVGIRWLSSCTLAEDLELRLPYNKAGARKHR